MKAMHHIKGLQERVTAVSTPERLQVGHLKYLTPNSDTVTLYTVHLPPRTFTTLIAQGAYRAAQYQYAA